MKVTYVEEIEAKRAWRSCMGCAQCGELKFDIHHQVQPEILESWWVECPNCGHEGCHTLSRDAAITWWKGEC